MAGKVPKGKRTEIVRGSGVDEDMVRDRKGRTGRVRATDPACMG